MTSILVVEDDNAIRDAVRRGLSDRGYAVATAATGMSGLEHVLAEHPQVVLLDLGLPDVSGLTLIPMIRAASEVPITFFIFGSRFCTLCRSQGLDRKYRLMPSVLEKD